jgi:Rho-binding antiterminator
VSIDDKRFGDKSAFKVICPVRLVIRGAEIKIDQQKIQGETAMSECRIACNLHDHIEVACLYGYLVRLLLKDKRVVEGQTTNIMTEEKREFLLPDNSETEKIALDQPVKLQVLTPNAGFSEVIF